MDTAQWAQGIGSMSSTTARPPAPPPPATQSAYSSSHQQQPQQQQLVERRARPVKEQARPCPRCNSTNTKFCYYNNYSLTQPRYFCKTCRRYWTEGGSLRNVPVGGGSRKNKRHSTSSSSSTTKINSNLQAPPATITSSSFPISAVKPYQGQDLNLAFSDQLMGGLNFPGNSNGGGGLSAMELLRSTGITPRGLDPLGMDMSMPETSAVYGTAGFGLHDFKFPFDGNGNGMQEGGGGGMLLFPFGDLKQVSQVKSSNESSDQENRVQGEQAIFWSGANLGGNGGSW